jgi:hypothetical protein
MFELLHLIRQSMCLVPRHTVGEADCSISRDVGVDRVVRVRDAGVGDGAVMSSRYEQSWPAACPRLPVKLPSSYKRLLHLPLGYA